MSMDEMLLQELYGSQQIAADEEIKQAQIQLVEAVAAEAGVDLNELSDAELSKFAEYVLSDEDEYDDDDDEEEEKGAGLSDMYDAAKARAGQAYEYAKSNPGKVGGGAAGLAALLGGAKMLHSRKKRRAAQMMEEKGAGLSDMYDAAKSHAGQAYEYAKSNPGKVGGGAAGLAALLGGAKMLHSRKKRRAAQMMEEKGASYVEDMQTKLAEADMIGRQMARSYADEISLINNNNGDTMNDTQMKVASAMSHVAAAWQAEMYGEGNIGALRSQLNTQEKTATLANAGYVGLAKIASYTPDQFAAEAELRAAEILAAYGVNPETLDDIQPTNVKLSSFPGVQDAADREEAAVIDEYNQMLDTAAMHIIENLLD